MGTCWPRAVSGSPGRWSRLACDEYRLVVQPLILGAGDRLFTMPLTIEPVSTTAFSRGAVAHVFAAHP
jgi:hypothetical protein